MSPLKFALFVAVITALGFAIMLWRSRREKKQRSLDDLYQPRTPEDETRWGQE